MPAPQLGFGSAPLGHAGQLAGAATGVGGLAARAPWRPPVSHWPALPIKTATGAPRPFQHLPALDSARSSPVDLVFCRTWRRKRRARAAAFHYHPQPRSSLFPRNPAPAPPPPQRGSDATEIHFGARRCLGQEASRGQRGLGQIEILQENSPSLVVTKHKTLREGTNGEGGEVDHLSSCQHPSLHALPAAKAAE